MLFLTLQIALSSLNILHNSTMFLPQIETIPEFETAWKANLNLAKAMFKDKKITDVLEPANWKKLQDVSSYVDPKQSPLVLFSVLEEILRVEYVERLIQTYPEYEFALLTVTQLSISVTKLYQPTEESAQNGNQVLNLQRMENALPKYLDRREVTSNCTEKSSGDHIGKKEIVTDLIKPAGTLAPTTIESAVHFLQVGSSFKLPNLERSSAQYLENTLSMESVVIIYQTAWNMKMEDLKEKAGEFILFEFEEISKNDENFIYLKFSELTPLLESDKLTVPNEYSVFEAIARWVLTDTVKRSEHLPALMETVRLHLCSLSVLNKMLDHNLLKDFKEVLHSIRSAIYLITLNSPIRPELIKKQQRLLQETLFVVGGMTSGQSSSTIETFSTSQQEWIYHQRLNWGSAERISAVPAGKKIITFSHLRNSVLSFDPVKKEWKLVSTWPNSRKSFGVAVLNDIIYLLGGNTFSDVVSSACQMYNTTSGLWTEMPSLKTARFHASAAALQDKVYIAGGVGVSTNYLDTVEMFNPATYQWNPVKPMIYKRYHFVLATADDYMWAFGGFNGGTTLNSVERYDPKSDIWTSMPAMPSPRKEHNIAYFFGNFYVMGDFGKERNTVDIYNPRKKTWKSGPNLNLGRFFFGACVIENLPNAADYVFET